MNTNPVHVVVLGAGFAGLKFCQTFTNPHARITIVDRQNHHLFQPLLYQVAAAGLSAPEIAQPVRSILSNDPRITVLMDEIEDLDLTEKTVFLKKGILSYDYLIVALGGQTSYFGHPEWEEFAPGLKSLDDALRIRREVLLAFERAENEPNKAEHDRLLTMTVIGGGPTGVELAGTFAELARTVLNKDFRRINPAEARVVLIEGSPRVLSNFSPELSASAAQQLQKLGVEVRVNTRVKNITRGKVELQNGESIQAENIIWAAGVAANSFAAKVGTATDRAGRLIAGPDLSLPGHPEVFALGDIAAVTNPDGTTVPGLCPAAMQMGVYVAKLLDRELSLHHDKTKPRPAFEYWDRGTMATIGRSAAVAKVGKLEFSGLPAWLAWLGIHLVFLIGFRNKLAVLLQWTYSYFAYKRGARIVFGNPKPLHQVKAPTISESQSK